MRPFSNLIRDTESHNFNNLAVIALDLHPPWPLVGLSQLNRAESRPFRRLERQPLCGDQPVAPVPAVIDIHIPGHGIKVSKTKHFADGDGKNDGSVLRCVVSYSLAHGCLRDGQHFLNIRIILCLHPWGNPGQAQEKQKADREFIHS